MNKKIPSDAFSFYFALGPGRSYETVAEKYGCTNRGVADYAKRERWQDRIADLEQRAREKADEQALESIEEMNKRHLKIAKFLQSKGLEGLQSGRLEMMAPGTKTCTAGIELERLIRGEPTERTENLETIVRREYERWMRPVDDAAGAELGAGSAESGEGLPPDHEEERADGAAPI